MSTERKNQICKRCLFLSHTARHMEATAEEGKWKELNQGLRFLIITTLMTHFTNTTPCLVTAHSPVSITSTEIKYKHWLRGGKRNTSNGSDWRRSHMQLLWYEKETRDPSTLILASIRATVDYFQKHDGARRLIFTCFSRLHAGNLG